MFALLLCCYGFTIATERQKILASFPVPCPAFRRLLYGTASDEKLGVVGLGTRLRKYGTAAQVMYKFYHTFPDLSKQLVCHSVLEDAREFMSMFQHLGEVGAPSGVAGVVVEDQLGGARDGLV